MPCNFSLTFISYWSSSTCPCCWGKRMIWSNNCNASESDLIENQWSHDSPLLAVQHLFSSAFFNHMINWMAYCQSSCRQALLFTSIGNCDVHHSCWDRCNLWEEHLAKAFSLNPQILHLHFDLKLGHRDTLYENRTWDKVFKNGPGKTCGR